MTGGGRLANDVSPKLNFETLKKIFTMEANAECEEIANFERVVNEYGSVFLDGQTEVPQVFFASVMRSGNTLSRKLMESVSGVLTGSNYPILPNINFALTV
jgi:hypothetical protein